MILKMQFFLTKKRCLQIKCTDENFKEIFFKDVQLGNTGFDGYISGVTDNEGKEMGRFFGAKRIGNLYLTCQFNFPDLKSFETYKAYFKGFTTR